MTAPYQRMPWLLAAFQRSDCRHLARQVFCLRFFHKTNGKVPYPLNIPLICLIRLTASQHQKLSFIALVVVGNSFQFTFSGNYSAVHTRVAQISTLGGRISWPDAHHCLYGLDMINTWAQMLVNAPRVCVNILLEDVSWHHLTFIQVWMKTLTVF